MVDDKALRLKLDRARWWMLLEQPFYGSLAMGLADVLVEHGASVEGTAVETAATDYRRIFWSRDFLASLNEEQTRGVIMHETLHCAHLHAWRLPRDADGNRAGDFAINGVLAGIKGISLPGSPLMPPPEWANLAEEEILARLPPTPPGGGKGPGGDPGGCGSFLPPAPDGDGEGDGKGGAAAPSEPGAKPGKGQGQGGGSNGPEAAPDGDGGAGGGADLKEEWQRRVIQAVQAGKASGKGDVPGDLLREVERVRHQPIDWRQETADWLKSQSATRPDWSRAARRHAWGKVLIPRRRADDLGLVVVVRDTSGSIGGALLAEFSALAGSLLAETRARGLVLDCDADVAAEYEVEPGDDVPAKAQGGGGTDFRPAFERADAEVERGERIAGLVYLTDGYGSFPSEAPDYPVLWLCTTDVVAPFGRTVRIEGGAA